MTRLGRLVLSAWLAIFGPLNYAMVLMGSLGTIGGRGIPAVVELIAQGAIAALAAAAVFAVWTDSLAAPRLSPIAVILVAASAIQSQFISWLPRQASPGQALPNAAAHALAAVVWLIWLRRPARSSR